MDVVLDTNAILLPFTQGTDLQLRLEEIFGTTTLVVPSSIVQELAGLASGRDKAGRAAKAAQVFLKRCRVERTDLPGDDGLLDVARRLGAVVVTNDKLLQQECRRSGLVVVASQRNGRLARLDA